MAILQFVLALLGLPLFVVAALGALWSFWHAGLDSTVIMLEFRRLAEFPALAALPLFTAVGLILQRESSVARVVRHARVLGPLSGLVPGLLSPGLTLLIFAAAAALLAPGTAPGHAELLQAGLPLVAIALAVVLVRRILSPSTTLKELRRDGLGALSLAWPAAVMLGLLYASWSSPLAVAALLLVWVVLDPMMLRGRVRRTLAPELIVEAVVRSMPAVLVLGLTLAWVALWQHRLGLPGAGTDGALINGVIQISTWLLSVAAAALAGVLIRHALAAMALIAPPAIVLAQATALDLVTLGVGLAVATAVGTELGQVLIKPDPD